MTKTKKQTKRRRGQSASKAMLSVDDRLLAIEDRLATIEKSISDVNDMARSARQAADGALYVANYCR